MTKKKTNILLTGGTGLIGSRLSQILLDKGYNVGILSRRKLSDKKIPSFVWDVEKKVIDVEALKWADIIVNLAGESIGAKRWNKTRKKIFTSSRVDGIELIRENIIKNKIKIDSFISASAIGYYGNKGKELITEESPPGNDFLSSVTTKWEGAISQMEDCVSRVAYLRIGFVLSNKGGGLVEMVPPVKWFIGSPLGTGKQYVAWIHIEDLCRMFVKLIEDKKLKGPFNGVGRKSITNKEFVKTIGKVIKRPVLLPPVPAFILRIIVGEMVMLVTNSTNISSKKIEGAGFKLKYIELEDALKDLLRG